MQFQYKTTLDLAKIVKTLDSSIKTVLGGYHATTAYEQILESEDINYFDFLIKGEGEDTFNNLLQALNDDNNYEKIPGLIYKNGVKAIINEKTTLLDLNTIKLPDRKSRILNKGFHVFGYKADVIETSRGCVQHCNFCSIREMYGKTFRKYSISRVIEDIKDAKKHGAKFIFISDDNITIDPKRFYELCQAIIQNKLHSIKYIIQASIDGLRRHPDLIRMMALAGVEIVFLGIETLSEEGLKALGKDNQFKVTDAEHVVKKLRANGIIVVAGFILGYPEDTRESVLANYEYAKRLKAEISAFSILTPFVKTEIRQELIDEGLLVNKSDYEKYDLNHVNIRTRHLSAEELSQLRDHINLMYTFESGTLKRLIYKYPLYFAKLAPRTFLKERIFFTDFIKQFGKTITKSKAA